MIDTPFGYVQVTDITSAWSNGPRNVSLMRYSTIPDK